MNNTCKYNLYFLPFLDYSSLLNVWQIEKVINECKETRRLDYYVRLVGMLSEIQQINYKNKKEPKRLFRMEEKVGFEPTVRSSRTTVFKTAPINRSGTSPINL